MRGRAVQVREDIPQGHKLALAQIAAGENIIKYGYPIGHAASDIPPGAWVHTHNVRTNLSGEVEYTYAPDVRPLSPVPPETFQGYRRADGRAGVRNELWIIPTVGCVNDCAKALAAENQSLVSGSIDGCMHFPIPSVVPRPEPTMPKRAAFWPRWRHPNAGGVLVLSLGCENLTHEQFAEELGPYDPARVKFLTCQDVEDEMEAGGALLAELAAHAGQARREAVPVCELVVGHEMRRQRRPFRHHRKPGGGPVQRYAVRPGRQHHPHRGAGNVRRGGHAAGPLPKAGPSSIKPRPC